MEIPRVQTKIRHLKDFLIPMKLESLQQNDQLGVRNIITKHFLMITKTERVIMTMIRKMMISMIMIMIRMILPLIVKETLN